MGEGVNQGCKAGVDVYQATNLVINNCVPRDPESTLPSPRGPQCADLFAYSNDRRFARATPQSLAPLVLACIWLSVALGRVVNAMKRDF